MTLVGVGRSPKGEVLVDGVVSWEGALHIFYGDPPLEGSQDWALGGGIPEGLDGPLEVGP